MILIDTREQKQDYIQDKLEALGVSCSTSALSHGMDYLIVGTHGSIGIQRKTFPEVATQFKDIREEIIPALLDLTDNPVLLVEEGFRIDEQGMMWRKEGNFLKPAQISARQYYNFLQSIRQMGCEVVCTRELDQSIWWMHSMHTYIHDEHYPKQKKRYGTDMQAIGILCCINSFGITASRKLLKQYSIRELCNMPEIELARILNKNQVYNLMKVREYVAEIAK